MAEKKTNILRNNPLMILLLGACPALAATTDVRAAAGMGVMVLAVLLLSGVIVSLLRSRIAAEAVVPTCILTVAGCTSVMQMILAAFLPSVYNMLGIYSAIVAVIVLTGRFACEAADGESVGETAKAAVTTGLYFLAILVVVAAVREFLGSASLAGLSLSFLEEYKIATMAKAPGAYIVLAIVAAVIGKVSMKKEKEEK